MHLTSEETLQLPTLLADFRVGRRLSSSAQLEPLERAGLVALEEARHGLRRHLLRGRDVVAALVGDVEEHHRGLRRRRTKLRELADAAGDADIRRGRIKIARVLA